MFTPFNFADAPTFRAMKDFINRLDGSNHVDASKLPNISSALDQVNASSIHFPKFAHMVVRPVPVLVRTVEVQHLTIHPVTRYLRGLLSNNP